FLKATRDRLPRRASEGVHLLVEELEDRSLLATITPTTFADTTGAGSLRDAVAQANSTPGDTTIQLAAGTYTLSARELVLAAAIGTGTLLGAGSGRTVIDAAYTSRLFEVVGNVGVVFQNLTLENGLATNGGATGVNAAMGGALLNNGGAVTLQGVAVTGSVAQASAGLNALGGGVFSSGQSLTINQSTITNNRALAGAGAPGADATAAGQDGAP